MNVEVQGMLKECLMPRLVEASGAAAAAPLWLHLANLLVAFEEAPALLASSPLTST